MKFRSRPFEIEAVQFNKAGDHPEVKEVQDDVTGKFWIGTRSGVAFVKPGDWIITEPDGSGHYPCAPEVFAAKYEEITEKQIDLLEEARTALQFYADKANHRQAWAQVSDCPSCSYRTSPVIEDEGQRARTFLAKLEERER